MYKDMRLQSYHPELFHCLQILCALPAHPRPGQWLTFLLNHGLRFPECHTFGIIHYVAFTDQFHSLSEVHLKFPHVSSWLESSLPFSWIIVRCLAAVGLFIHSHHTWLAHRWHVGSVVTEALGNNQTKAGISWRNVSHAVRWVGRRRRRQWGLRKTRSSFYTLSPHSSPQTTEQG